MHIQRLILVLVLLLISATQHTIAEDEFSDEAGIKQQPLSKIGFVVEGHVSNPNVMIGYSLHEFSSQEIWFSGENNGIVGTFGIGALLRLYDLHTVRLTYRLTPRIILGTLVVPEESFHPTFEYRIHRFSFVGTVSTRFPFEGAAFYIGAGLDYTVIPWKFRDDALNKANAIAERSISDMTAKGFMAYPVVGFEVTFKSDLSLFVEYYRYFGGVIEKDSSMHNSERYEWSYFKNRLSGDEFALGINWFIAR